MKHPLIIFGSLIVMHTCAEAALVATFDHPSESQPSFQAMGGGTGPTIVSSGGFGGSGYLQLTPSATHITNFATYDTTDYGLHPKIEFSFRFRIDQHLGGADGFTFALLDTSIHGQTGPLPTFAGLDGSASVLMFSFDTYGNGDWDPLATGSNYSEISVFYNGTQARIDDTRLLPNPFDLKDGNWHTAAGTIRFDSQTIDFSVDGSPIWKDFSIPNLLPYESRVGMLGLTGDLASRHSIDDLNVAWVPEPATASFSALGVIAFLTARRRTFSPEQ